MIIQNYNIIRKEVTTQKVETKWSEDMSQEDEVEEEEEDNDNDDDDDDDETRTSASNCFHRCPSMSL
jgi:hypothetical protein